MGPATSWARCAPPADRAAAAAGLRAAVEAEGRLLLADRLRADEGWDRLLGGVVLRREPSPALALGGDWDAYLASRSANFRQGLRRRERRLGRDHGLRFRLADDPDRLPADVETLFALHAARFGDRSSIGGPRTRAFHHDLSARALAGGWLRLWIAELDGRPAAAWYGFRLGGREWYYQAGWDPARARDGIGLVLLAHTVREAMRDGMREYRFLRGGEPFKARFGPRDDGLVTVGLAPGATGRAALSSARAALACTRSPVPAAPRAGSHRAPAGRERREAGRRARRLLPRRERGLAVAAGGQPRAPGPAGPPPPGTRLRAGDLHARRAGRARRANAGRHVRRRVPVRARRRAPGAAPAGRPRHRVRAHRTGWAATAR
jgi:CelD/BcsL family acetyltransferase involved in cellulose biosynthesis